MSDIPILEIDCDVEFHDDEAIKKRMLDQVNILALFRLNINFQILGARFRQEVAGGETCRD